MGTSHPGHLKTSQKFIRTFIFKKIKYHSTFNFTGFTGLSLNFYFEKGSSLKIFV